MKSSHCRRYRAKTGVGFQAVHGNYLLLLAHLDGECLHDHQVGAAIWGCQRLLLAANSQAHMVCLG
jgi:hypothetical protein